MDIVLRTSLTNDTNLEQMILMHGERVDAQYSSRNRGRCATF